MWDLYPNKENPNAALEGSISALSLLQPQAQPQQPLMLEGSSPYPVATQEQPSIQQARPWTDEQRRNPLGGPLTQHVIDVATGEDIGVKLMAFLKQERRHVCILSATGTVSRAWLRSANSLTFVKYEWQCPYRINRMWYTKTRDGIPTKTGNLIVNLGGPHSNTVEGCVRGRLVAGSPVTVTVVSHGPERAELTATESPVATQQRARPRTDVVNEQTRNLLASMENPNAAALPGPITAAALPVLHLYVPQQPVMPEEPSPYPVATQEQPSMQRGRPRSDGGGANVNLPAKRGRGHAHGSVNVQRRNPLGEGQSFLDIINVAAGEDIATELMDFLIQEPRNFYIHSASGTVSRAWLQANTPLGIHEYEGLYNINHMWGTFLKTVCHHGPVTITGNLIVSLAGPHGQILEGCVGGVLVAGSPVQVVVGSFAPENVSSSSGGGNSTSQPPPQLIYWSGYHPQ